MTHITVNIRINPKENPNKIATIISEKCKQENIDFDMSVRPAREYMDDIEKRYEKLIEIGESIAIKINTTKTSKIEYEPTDRTIVEINPEWCFGDGLHETTRLCIKAIERNINKEYSVLDVGCGSGILSITSLVLGANSATGVDINQHSINMSRYNAELNGIEDKYTLINGNLVDSVEGKFDLVVANMLTNELKALLVDIKKYMHHDSILILSGIIDFRCGELIEVSKEDFYVVNKTQENNWVCLELKLNADCN